MEEEFVKIIRKTGTSLGINLPKEIIKLMSLKEGDMIRVRVIKIKGD